MRGLVIKLNLTARAPYPRRVIQIFAAAQIAKDPAKANFLSEFEAKKVCVHFVSLLQLIDALIMYYKTR